MPEKIRKNQKKSEKNKIICDSNKDKFLNTSEREIVQKLIQQILSLEGDKICPDQLYEMAFDAGLIEEITAHKPCGKRCKCANLGFPIICGRLKIK